MSEISIPDVIPVDFSEESTDFIKPYSEVIKESTDVDSFSVIEPPLPAKKRGRPKGSKNLKVSPTVEPIKPVEPVTPIKIEIDFNLIVETINTIAINAAGDEAGLNDLERSLIITGAQNVADKIPLDKVKQINDVIAPMMLIAGLGLWILRIIEVRRKNKPVEPVKPISNVSPVAMKTEKKEDKPANTEVTNGFNPSLTVSEMNQYLFQQ